MGAMAGEGFTGCSATAMLARLASGETSSVALVDAHIRRIEQLNPALNAIVVPCFDQARAQAEEADRRRRSGAVGGLLAGLPITVKECFGLAGTPDTFGIGWRAGLRAERDDAYVAALRAEGGIVLGKSNLSQCLLYLESDNPVYGRCNNPWNAERSCGGSSGGEGAIIAAGGSPLGFATDIGGSARIPAAFCGIAGFKPTQGRAPDPGRYSIPIGQQAIPSQIGVLARRVEDIALGLGVVSQVHADSTPTLCNHRLVDITKLRVAFHTDDGSLTPSPAVQRAVRAAADSLRSAGIDVIEWTPPAVAEATHLYFALLSGDAGDGFRRALRGGRMDPRLTDLSRLARMPASLRWLLRHLLAAFGQPRLAEFLGHFGHGRVAEHWALVEAQMDYRRRFAEAMAREHIDVILGPPCAVPAYTHGAARDVGLGGSYSLLWNLLGYPAGVVPLGRVHVDEESSRPASGDIIERALRRIESGSAGLPVAVQVAARPWREHEALAVMQVIETAASQSPDWPLA